MAAQQQILKEYLLSLGFKIDESSSRRFDTSLLKFDFSVSGLAKKVLGVAAAAQVMVAVFARSMENMYYASKRTDATVGNIQALEYAGKQVGLSAGTMQSALENMARALRANPGLQGLLHDLGVQVEGRDKSDVLVDLVKQLKGMPFYVAQQYASLFGINPDDLFMLQQSVVEFEKARDARKAMANDAGLDLDKVAGAAKNYSNALGQIYERMGLLKDIMMVSLLPLFKSMADSTIDALDALNKYLGKWSKVPLTKQASDATSAVTKGVSSYWDFTKKFWGAMLGSSQPAKPGFTPGPKDPIGLRQNNPGNLRSWPGAGSGGGFAQFGTAAEGISAMAQNLLTYYRKYGLDTVSAIIKRWAPSNENNTGAYIKAVSKMMGLDANQKLDLNDPEMLASLMQAITTHENGKNPYDPTAFKTAAAGRLGRTTVLQQTTQITVQSPDPDAAGRAVASHQDRVNATLTRNLAGALE